MRAPFPTRLALPRHRDDRPLPTDGPPVEREREVADERPLDVVERLLPARLEAERLLDEVELPDDRVPDEDFEEPLPDDRGGEDARVAMFEC